MGIPLLQQFHVGSYLVRQHLVEQEAVFRGPLDLYDLVALVLTQYQQIAGALAERPDLKIQEVLLIRENIRRIELSLPA